LARYKRKDAYTAESRTDKAAMWRETMDTENKKKMEELSPKEEREFNQKLTFVREEYSMVGDGGFVAKHYSGYGYDIQLWQFFELEESAEQQDLHDQIHFLMVNPKRELSGKGRFKAAWYLPTIEELHGELGIKNCVLSTTLSKDQCRNIANETQILWKLIDEIEADATFFDLFKLQQKMAMRILGRMENPPEWAVKRYSIQQ